LALDDVVEITCDVDADGVRPVPLGSVRASTASLMSSVKTYEQLTVAAVAEQSRNLAIEALIAHPMVLSYSQARALVDGYASAHHAYVPWLA